MPNIRSTTTPGYTSSTNKRLISSTSSKSAILPPSGKQRSNSHPTKVHSGKNRNQSKVNQTWIPTFISRSGQQILHHTKGRMVTLFLFRMFLGESIRPINDNAYIYDKINQTWLRQVSHIPLKNLKLIEHSLNLPLYELDFSFRHHPSHETQTLEQLNVLTELLSKIQETNSDSLSDLMMNVQTKSDVWDASNRMTNVKHVLIAVAELIVLAIAARVLFYFKAAFGYCCPKIKIERKNIKNQDRDQ